MQKTVLVPVADGTEELEAVAIIDVLRRAGATVTVASVTGARQITASRGVVIVADALIEACLEMEFDLVVLPGGIPGAEHLRDSAELIGILRRQRDKDRLYGAICASPAVVLEHHGLLAGQHGHLSSGLFRSTVCRRIVSNHVWWWTATASPAGGREPPSNLPWPWWSASMTRKNVRNWLPPW